MSEKHIGKVVQVTGPVLDIRFAEGELPALLNLFFVIVCDLSVVGVALASAISQCVSAFLILRALTRVQDCYALDELAEKNLRLNEKLTHMGQRTTRAKLMSYFSDEAQRRGGYEFDIPFSRQQLADYLGVERSGLSLELGKMRDEGLLDFHKNHFLLKLPEADRPFPSAR